LANLFTDIKYINEVKLKRYAFAEMPYFGKTNIMTIAGATILRTERKNFYFEFNDEFAVELENFDVDSAYVRSSDITQSLG
jgi:hypothetical protein